MSFSEAPLIVSFSSVSKFLTRLLEQHAPPSTLIVCSTREFFLEGLLIELRQESRELTVSSQTIDTPNLENSLLSRTLHLIARSKSISLAFTPTLPHLRAYLATYVHPVIVPDEHITYEKPGTHVSTLAILNSLTLHRPTSDFSAQGLSRTFALLVDVAAREGMQLLVTEGDLAPEDEEMQTDGDGASQTPRDPWSEQVPLLNGSIRFGGEERLWAGRTVEVRKVVSRWFRFETMDSDGNAGRIG